MKKSIALLALAPVLLFSSVSLYALTVQACSKSNPDADNSLKSVCSDACGVFTWNGSSANAPSKCLYTQCGCKP
jgi:hypothetical protein